MTSLNEDKPLVYDLPWAEHVPPQRYDQHNMRHLSDMRGQFRDEKAYRLLLSEENKKVYEFYEFERPAAPGDLKHGLSIVYPGRVGDEFFMTKGHFHSVLDTAEIYYCLRGEGMMVMETPEGECVVESLHAGSVLYVPPRWAHRLVNTRPDQPLAALFVYPANAGHDYGSIEAQGFRKLVVQQDGRPIIIDNQNWLPPDRRPSL